MREDEIHRQVCRYLRLQYPNVIFNTDLSGLKMTQGQAVAVRDLRSSRGFPDIAIYCPKNGFNGLFIELKAVSPFKKNGDLKASEHLKEQVEMIERLNELGYFAKFATGFEESKIIIDNYLR